MMMVMIRGFECERGMILGGLVREISERDTHTHTHTPLHKHTHAQEDSLMKPTKHCLKKGEGRGKWEHNGGGELVQSTLYTHMESPL
jgi:hypothetical protein